ncbi:MAG TPA: SpoIIE family protein phosphatase [Terracidiphilus sp.]|nr:SpoIIE family protein phosphatase [Terracidiphilus sp.]
MDIYRCPAFWPGTRQVLRVAARILHVAGLTACLAVVVCSTEIHAQSPVPPPQAPASAVQTIDAASLGNVVDLDGPWRFHIGDDQRFADPALDDSDWPSIRPNQKFKTPFVAADHGGYLWARIHIRVPSASRLALAVRPAQTVQYEVFVNGSPIASTPGMASRTPRTDWPFAVALPQSGDMVLAIRFYSAASNLGSLPIQWVRIGPLGAVQLSVELESLDIIHNWLFINCVCLGVNLLIGLTAMILYRSQRDHDEYLWLGIACLMFVLYGAFEIAYGTGWVPFTRPVLGALECAGFTFNAAHIEFFVRFTQVRRRWPIRIVQGAQLVQPLLALLPIPTFSGLGFVIAQFLFTAAISVCLISAFRRGMADSRLLLIPGVAAVSCNLAWAAAVAFPSHVPWGTNLHFGHFGIEVNYLGMLLFCLGIAAVVLYRFVRVTREEERAAAELEAARTVQQILVPEEVPSIPGFSIQAVYQPAGQVGGDFYQVLPTPNGGLLAVIGDVSGKGMPAAMTVSLLVGTVRTLAHYTHDPAEILTAMNQRLIGRGSGFTTALVLRLDPDGTLAAANAGHIAPYANGRELAIDNSLPLGITAAAAYSNSTLHLEANTTLTLLTDGVIEAQNAQGELFGFERAAQISQKPAQSVAQAAQTFGQQDDITVLSLALVAAS